MTFIVAFKRCFLRSNSCNRFKHWRTCRDQMYQTKSSQRQRRNASKWNFSSKKVIHFKRVFINFASIIMFSLFTKVKTSEYRWINRYIWGPAICVSNNGTVSYKKKYLNVFQCVIVLFSNNLRCLICSFVLFSIDVL